MADALDNLNLAPWVFQQALAALSAAADGDFDSVAESLAEVLTGEPAEAFMLFSIMGTWAMMRDEEDGGGLEPVRARELVVTLTKYLIAVWRGIEFAGGKPIAVRLQELGNVAACL